MAILLCTYHGQQFLGEQLDSIAAQDYTRWTVWASDDGSQDATRSILDAYRNRWGKHRLSVRSGPRDGFTANFLALTCAPDIKADLYAFADQDDIWESDKLQRAVNWLDTVDDEVPALYCSRTKLVDADGKPIGYSPLFSKSPCFANALVQSLAGGNTMVFNDAARKLLCEAGRVKVVTHDWWAYMVVAGCGGRVFYDPHPSLRYRQHGSNLIGGGAGWLARLLRVRMIFKGRLREWNDRNIQALGVLRPKLTSESLRVLDAFAAARGRRRLVPRILGVLQSGVCRQTIWGNVGLLASVLFKKF